MRISTHVKNTLFWQKTGEIDRSSAKEEIGGTEMQTKSKFSAVREKFKVMFGSNGQRCFDYLDRHGHGIVSKKDIDLFLEDEGFELSSDEVIDLAIEMGIREVEGSTDTNPEFAIQKVDFFRWFDSSNMDNSL